MIRRFREIEAGDVGAVGGKGLSLGLLARAGLPVPDGFCLTTEAFRRARAALAGGVAGGAAGGVAGAGEGEPGGAGERLIPEDLGTLLRQHYRELGGGLVAVRSSATAEDGATTSFAGQQETILGVEGESALEAAVWRCWASWNSERARAYREKQQLSHDSGGLAVVVQRLIPSDMSGVLFTQDPLDPTGTQMLVEAAWGLGEMVVSGRVTPDRYHLHRQEGTVTHQELGTKTHKLTARGVEAIPLAEQQAPCLTLSQLRDLLELGHRVEQYYGERRDIEWGIADGKLWLLQARPVTTAGAFEREQVRQREIDHLRHLADPDGTVWAKYNLAEVLPQPTPMTWSIVRQFMSGRGGLGLMYRDLGFLPDPRIDEAGIIDLICGVPYVNLSREPWLYYRDFPYGHDFAKLKRNPDQALYPQPEALPGRKTWRFYLRLPITIWGMVRSQLRVRSDMGSAAKRLRETVFPAFSEQVAEAQREDWSQLPDTQLLEKLAEWKRRTLEDLARESLRPALFAATAMASLEGGVTSTIGAERAAVTVREWMTGVRPPAEVDLPHALEQLAHGTLSEADFLHRFGHRGPAEMELAQPRWSESSSGLPRRGEKRASAAGQGANSTRGETSQVSHMSRTEADHGTRESDERALWNRLAEQAGVPQVQREILGLAFFQAREYLGLREAGKHYLMLGYALIRQALLELDRRYNLRGGIFYLEYDELPRLVAGESFETLIPQRKQYRQLALSLEVPAVLFSDDLSVIGKPQAAEAATDLTGTPVSAGVVEGEALVLTDPNLAPNEAQDFVLVCPSTDPAWVPLFLRAKGLVMETGGVLSHGAIVAREFGLPAVVGIRDVHHRLKTGQRVRVDGNTGTVQVEEGR